MAIAKSIQNYINSKKKVDTTLREKPMGGQWNRQKRECVEVPIDSRREHNVSQMYDSINPLDGSMPGSLIVSREPSNDSVHLRQHSKRSSESP